jgi:kynurenine 3-monooxygenase
MFKVCIIGAGPAGMVLALALSKQDNVAVTVFEKGPSHLGSNKFNPDRSYTIDMTGHGAKALGLIIQLFVPSALTL